MSRSGGRCRARGSPSAPCRRASFPSHRAPGGSHPASCPHDAPSSPGAGAPVCRRRLSSRPFARQPAGWPTDAAACSSLRSAATEAGRPSSATCCARGRNAPSRRRQIVRRCPRSRRRRSQRRAAATAATPCDHQSHPRPERRRHRCVRDSPECSTSSDRPEARPAARVWRHQRGGIRLKPPSRSAQTTLARSPS